MTDTSDDDEERQVMCSGCGAVVQESKIHVIPYYNDAAENYVTTYRCATCWLPAIETTRARVAACEDADEIDSLARFFERHAIFVHEAQRGDPLPITRAVLERLVGLLGAETIRLTIGPTA